MTPEVQKTDQTRLSRNQVSEILKKGILAPSADNLQPWKFRVLENGVDLLLNPELLASYCDEGYAAPYLSAGAVLENIRVAASAFGAGIRADYFPETDHPLKPIHIDWVPGGAKQHPHLSSLEKRCTNRKFYKASTPVPDSVFRALENQSDPNSGYRLLWLKQVNAHYKDLASLIGEADQLRFEIFRLHQELMKVMRFSDKEAKETRDGLPLNSLDAGPSAGLMFGLIRSWNRLQFLNTLGMSFSFNLYAKLQMLSSQACGLIVAPGKAPEHYVRGGEIMQRIWHEEAAQGLALQPMEALPIFLINSELTSGRDLSGEQRKKLENMKSRFTYLFGLKPWQGLILLFRIGYASPPGGRSLRRPLETFMLPEESLNLGNRD